MHISSTSTFCTFKPLQVGRLSLFRTLLFITPLFRISYLLNGTSSGDPTQTCYCIMGFHENILYVVKMCTISLKIMEVSLWILELFRLKCGWSHCLRTNTVGLFPMLLWCYNQCVWSQQSGRGGGGVITNDYSWNWLFRQKGDHTYFVKIYHIILSPSKKDGLEEVWKVLYAIGVKFWVSVFYHQFSL